MEDKLQEAVEMIIAEIKRREDAAVKAIDARDWFMAHQGTKDQIEQMWRVQNEHDDTAGGLRHALRLLNIVGLPVPNPSDLYYQPKVIACICCSSVLSEGEEKFIEDDETERPLCEGCFDSEMDYHRSVGLDAMP